MRFRDSSKAVGGAGELRGADDGVAEPAARRGALSRLCQWTLLGGIRFYQAVFSPVMPGNCKFYPTCSRYAAEAIAVYGPGRGTALALARLWRCRPFARGGVDPVPAPHQRSEEHAHPTCESHS